MNFSCPVCAQYMQCPDDAVGKKAICPKCGQTFAIPSLVVPVAALAYPPRVAEMRLHGGDECPFCHANRVARERGLQGPTEFLICLILIFMGIIPGVVYYVWVESIPYCTGCGRRVRP